MEENKLLNDTPEQVVIFPEPRIIKIEPAQPERAYGLFDSETGTQVTGFKKGTGGQVEFADLQPSRHYDVGAIENMGEDKPERQHRRNTKKFGELARKLSVWIFNKK